MGRKATAQCQWQNQSAKVRALLEATEIILRGALRLRLPRSAIQAVTQAGDDLVVTSTEGVLTLTLGATEAAKWRDHLSRPAPSLSDKLGISADRPAFLLGVSDDPDLSAALCQAQTDDRAKAAVLIGIIDSETDLAAAIAAARSQPTLHLWCIYPKGKTARLTDSTIRRAMRDAGFIDSKSCAISDRLTATRYRQRAET